MFPWPQIISSAYDAWAKKKENYLENISENLQICENLQIKWELMPLINALTVRMPNIKVAHIQLA